MTILAMLADLNRQQFIHLTRRIGVVVFLLMFFQVSYGKELILYVTTDGRQNQIRDTDLDSYKKYQSSLTQFFTSGSKQTAKIVEARLANINDLPYFIESSLERDESIRFIVFQGHGNHKEIAFDLANRFDGDDLAELVTTPRILNKLSNRHLSIYFPACQCGLTPDSQTPSFQEIFSETFTKLAKAKGKQFEVFQSIAHPNLQNAFALTPGVGYIS